MVRFVRLLNGARFFANLGSATENFPTLVVVEEDEACRLASDDDVNAAERRVDIPDPKTQIQIPGPKKERDKTK